MVKRLKKGWASGAILLVLALAGCATQGSGVRSSDPSTIVIVTGAGESWELRRNEDVRTNQRVDVSPAAAWRILPAVYAELGLSPDVLEEQNRLLGVQEQRFSGRILNRAPSDFFDCGLDPGLNRPTADRSPIDARVVTRVLGSGEASELETVVEGSARRTGGNAGIAQCRSTGLMESLIGQMVQGMAAPG